jgi:Zn-dependent M32 family carboxypeptidase
MPEGAGRSPPDLTDPTQQEKIIARLEEEGVDVSEVRTLLQNGDTEAVRAWLKAHKPEIPAGSARSPPDLSDATRQERIITRLEQQGVDVTEVKSGLQNGDTTAVKAWLENYVHSHEGEMPFRNHPGETPCLGRTGTSQ